MLVGRLEAAKPPIRLSTPGNSHIYNVMRHRYLVTAYLGLGIVASRAAAQGQPGIEFSALGVWHNKTVPHDGLRGFGAGTRLGVRLPAGFQVEGGLDVTVPYNSARGIRYKLFNVSGAALYNIPVAAGSVYLRAGYGKLAPRNCSIRSVGCSAFGAMIGGAGLRVPLWGPVQLRAEGMFRFRPTYDYRSFGGSIGLSVVPRASASASTGTDTDGDGVPDRRDRCRDTPRGALADPRGCPSDLDQDGVLDGIDRCPATPAGVTVDGFGCPVRRPD